MDKIEIFTRHFTERLEETSRHADNATVTRITVRVGDEEFSTQFLNDYVTKYELAGRLLELAKEVAAMPIKKD